MMIKSKDRLIFALDVPDFDRAKSMIKELGDSVSFYKIGLELMASGCYFDLIEYLKSKDKKIFADLKFLDIPNTVRKATENIAKHGVDLLTVHAHRDNILAAVEGGKGDLNILAVTVLTSIKQEDFKDKIIDVAIARAQLAEEEGAYGIVCSGHEVQEIKAKTNKIAAVCPGIRPFPTTDDQARVVNVEQAFNNGADYIVVGRPISEADDPRAAAEEIQGKIAKIFS